MEIFQAIRLGDRGAYHTALQRLNINIQDEDGQSLLHEAIACNNLDFGLDLIKRGINVNLADDNAQTALHFAALYNSFQLASAILKNGGNLNLTDVHGNNPLWTAVFNCKGKHYDMVQLFMENGGDPLTKNKHGRSPLDFANQVKDQKLINILSK
jgi:uncharacterized protein